MCGARWNCVVTIIFVNREVIACVKQQIHTMVTCFFLEGWHSTVMLMEKPQSETHIPIYQLKACEKFSVLTATTKTLWSWSPDWIWCCHCFQPAASNTHKLALLHTWWEKTNAPFLNCFLWVFSINYLHTKHTTVDVAAPRFNLETLLLPSCCSQKH